MSEIIAKIKTMDKKILIAIVIVIIVVVMLLARKGTVQGTGSA